MAHGVARAELQHEDKTEHENEQQDAANRRSLIYEYRHLLISPPQEPDLLQSPEVVDSAG